MTTTLLSPDLRTRVQDAHKMLIGSEWVSAASGATLSVEDPATGQVVAEVPAGDIEDVDRAVAAARAALRGPWSRITPQERGKLIWRLADLIEARAQELAELESLDAGMPIMEARYVDVAFSIDVLRYYAGWPTKITGDTIPVSFPMNFGGPYHAYTVREPVGVVAAIVPWNLPLMMAVKKLAPALATGNTIVVKPAEQTPLSIALLANLVLEAGIPEGVFNYVTGYGETVGAALVEHPGVDKISFTGSGPTGKAIARAATGTLKRVSLELGGKSPNLIFDDADLVKAIPSSALAIFACQGESCVAGSRLYAQRGVYDEVVAGLAERARSIKLGPGLDPSSEMGPLISAEHRDKVLGYIDLGRKEGVDVVTGGGRHGAEGYFVEPTILTNVHARSRLVREEIFGPVLSVIPFDSEDEVLGLANDSEFGLGAGVWTRDLARAHRLSGAIEAGQVWVNCYQAVDAALPFGGYKQSGWGRETCRENLDEFLELKTVVIGL
ncbi:aldehyde dehydrogenase family protein [Antrihabitans sp. YC3-6]|uniref:Aldehyde dehydrogenase family protein n=1 Tax=Antrihabitans stalagmiti TaxID=2799499 RepID=A0A934NLA7_9NOCA|nr:aldehyde dehydrogenase family protein [Antrihabitans stalagmiti]MBJ8337298.1 aldehyde dehydrogenase family protein [Antrihabitans stalagmiti]